MKRKLIILGVDGLPWNLVDAYAPTVFKNIVNLKRWSTFGDLVSTIPPVTAPAWVSFQTGLLPTRHGIVDFIQPDSEMRMKIVSNTDVPYYSFFELLSQRGYKVITLNLPLGPRSGCCLDTVDSWLSPGEKISDYCSSDLLKKYKTLINYIPYNDFLKLSSLKSKIKRISEICEKRIDTFREIFKSGDYDLYFGLISATDWLQHFTFADLINKKTENSLVKLSLGIYKMIDCFIGEMFEYCKNNKVDFLIMSDHGFKTFEGKFFINAWLHKYKYLKYSGRGGGFIPKEIDEMTDGNRNFDIGKLMDIIVAHKHLYKLVRWLYKSINEVFGFKVHIKRAIDIRASEAWCISSNSQMLYINRKETNKSSCVVDLKTKLKREKNIGVQQISFDPFLGKRWTLPSLYLYSDKYKIQKNLIKSTYIEEPCVNHSRVGVYSFYHGGDKVGKKDAHITDIAPTIMSLFGLKLSNSDGESIFKIERAQKIVNNKKRGNKGAVKSINI